jgi:hypothetical protein
MAVEDGMPWRQSSYLPKDCWMATPHLRQPGTGKDLTTAPQAIECLVPKRSNYSKENKT